MSWRARALAPIAAVLLMLCSAIPGSAQQWHDISASHGPATLDTLRVRLEYTVGSVSLERGSSNALYQTRLRYDADRFAPIRSFDSSTATLRIGVRGDDAPLRVGKGKEIGTLQLALSPQPALDLELELGATDARLDLGGLRVARLEIQSGASDITLGFDSPNLAEMSEMVIHAGVAHIDATGLGRARTSRITVEGGVGSVDLDFAGSTENALDVSLELAVGSATIRVPSDYGVKLSHSRVLAILQADGLVEENGEMVSANWESAERRITIDAETVFGRLQIIRTSQ